MAGAGGRKTDATLGEFLKHQHEWRAAAKGLFIRRKQSDLVNTPGTGHRLSAGAPLERGRRAPSPSGSSRDPVHRYLDRDEDAERYQGGTTAASSSRS